MPAPKVRSIVKRTPGYSLDQPDCRIKLNQNESPYDLPDRLKSRIIKKLGQESWNRYPSPYADELRKLLAKQLGWKAEGILFANGSNVLTQALVAATAVGGQVLVPDPTFSLYELYGWLFNNKVEKVRLRRDFSLDVTKFLAAIKRVKPNITFIPNPNAPTGNLFERRDLEQIIKAASGVIVIDEAYYPFSGETLFPLLKKYPHLVLLRTFSKAFSLGGVRVGYLLGQPSLVNEVRKLVPPFCLNALSEQVARAAIQSPAYVNKLVREIVSEREVLLSSMSKLPGVEVFPSDANFILFRSRRYQAIYKGLIQQGVLIRNVAHSGPLKNCLRVTVGSPRENSFFLRALKAL